VLLEAGSGPENASYQQREEFEDCSSATDRILPLAIELKISPLPRTWQEIDRVSSHGSTSWSHMQDIVPIAPSSVFPW
jgi:hypothetical protein